MRDAASFRNLPLLDERRDVSSGVKNRDDLQRRRRITIDNQVGPDRPKPYLTICKVATEVALPRPSRELLECRKELVDLPVRCSLTVSGDEVPDALEVAQGFRSEQVRSHRATYCACDAIARGLIPRNSFAALQLAEPAVNFKLKCRELLLRRRSCFQKAKSLTHDLGRRGVNGRSSLFGRSAARVEGLGIHS